MKKRLEVLLAGAALFVAACGQGPYDSTQAGSATPVRLLYSGLHCGRADRTPAIEQIASAERLEHAYARLTRDTVPGRSVAPPGFSFDEEIALLVEMGEQPTAGYRLAPGAATAPIRAGVAEVRLNWEVSPAGAIAAQMVTSPCILIGLGRGAYASVRIIDQHHRERLRTSVQ